MLTVSQTFILVLYKYTPIEFSQPPYEASVGISSIL